jgi:PAS domain-containing protein
MSDPLPTCFAPAERKGIAQIAREHQHILAIPHLQELLNAFPTPAVILNECRQIVAANQRLCRLLNRREDELLGMRPGEAFNCIHWRDGDCGGGTSRFCETCGAIRAILRSQRQSYEDTQECTIIRGTDEGEKALDLRVTASCFDLEGTLTLLSLEDIGDEKRRALLEKIFYHEVRNTAAGVRGLLEILPELSDQCRRETAHLAYQLAEYLMEEIEGGKDLATAEPGELALQPTALDVRAVLKSVC